MKRVLIMENGNAPAEMVPQYGEFPDQFLRALGKTDAEALVVKAYTSPSWPKLADISAIIVTGSMAMLSEHQDWMEQAARWLRGAVEAKIPILGVCFGHQLLAYAMGGTADYNPHGPEYGTVAVDLTTDAQNDPLFNGLPASLSVQVCHSQSVIALPPQAVLLAGNAHDPHHAFRMGPCAWGTQFHPEFDAAMTRLSIAISGSDLAAKGLDCDALSDACQETPAALHIMQRFAVLTDQHAHSTSSLDNLLI